MRKVKKKQEKERKKKKSEEGKKKKKKKGETNVTQISDSNDIISYNLVQFNIL